MNNSQIVSNLSLRVAALLAELPQVTAVALGGSRASPSGAADASSDIDLYVYTTAEIPLAERDRIVELAGGASQASLGLTYWGPGDEWYHAPTGIEVDLVYFDTRWMEDQLQRVIVQHRAALGYTTCLWYTARHSQPLYDPADWLAGLQNLAATEYPEALRANIIALNHPVLRQIIPAYAHQLEKAARRGDLVSVNHRLAGLFASYFDIVFAYNRRLHPGEKRLLVHAAAQCPVLPTAMTAEVTAVLQAAALPAALLPAAEGEPPRLMACVNQLLDHLDQLLEIPNP